MLLTARLITSSWIDNYRKLYLISTALLATRIFGVVSERSESVVGLRSTDAEVGVHSVAGVSLPVPQVDAQLVLTSSYHVGQKRVSWYKAGN